MEFTVALNAENIPVNWGTLISEEGPSILYRCRSK